MNMSPDRRARLRGPFLGVAAAIVLLAAIGAVMRPGFCMIEARGHGFNHVPSIGTETFALCFSGQITLRTVEQNSLLSLAAVLIANPSNLISRRIAELRGKSACPSGVSVDLAWTRLRKIEGPVTSVPGHFFKFVRAQNSTRTRLELTFPSQPDVGMLPAVCEALKDGQFPLDFPIDLNVGNSSREFSCANP
jgi:hypothetical protein